MIEPLQLYCSYVLRFYIVYQVTVLRTQFFIEYSNRVSIVYDKGAYLLSTIYIFILKHDCHHVLHVMQQR